MPEQSIRFASIDGRKVAWAAVGEGPPLVMGGWWTSHLELDWRNPALRDFVGLLGRHRTVIRYDRPGTGLSAPDGPPPVDLDAEVSALAGLVDELGADRVDLLAGSSGGPVAASYAAINPARVERMVLYGAYANGAEIADRAAQDAILGVVRQHWGLGTRVLADIFMPSATAEERDAFAEFQRESASADLAADSMRAVYSVDARHWLENVKAPTLVLHRRDDRAIPFSLGRDLAARIPGATFRALEGSDHFPWLGDAGDLAAEILEGLGVEDVEVVPRAPESRAERGPADSDLSQRELEVLKLVALGLSDGAIAERLTLSPHTVHRHVANVRTKLRLPSRAAAAAQAARLGLI